MKKTRHTLAIKVKGGGVHTFTCNSIPKIDGIFLTFTDVTKHGLISCIPANQIDHWEYAPEDIDKTIDEIGQSDFLDKMYHGQD